MIRGTSEQTLRGATAPGRAPLRRRLAAAKSTRRAAGLAAGLCSLVAVTGLSAPASVGQSNLTTASSRAALAAPANVVWTRINGGTNSATQIGDSLGLARTADGVLHVIWNRGSSASNGVIKIFETLISPSGSVMATWTVASGWDSLAGGNALIVMPDKTLRLFVTGESTPKASSGVNMLTAPASGRPFTLDTGHVWGGEFGAASPYIAATLSHGQIVTAWAGSFNVGLVGTPHDQYPTVHSFMSVPQLATDAKTGAVVFSGITNEGKGGVFVEQVLPGRGPAVFLSTDGNTDPGVSGATARIGARGVYILVANSNAKTLSLVRYDGSTVVVARGEPYYYCNVFAAPGGKLWVVWWPGTGNDLFATRSNGAVSKFEAVQALPLPTNLQLDDNPLYGNGSGGPLDLFARMSTSSLQGFLFTHVLALMNLTSAVVPIKSKKGKLLGQELKIFVSDAGDPVPGATVTIGKRKAVTKTAGVANFTYPGSPTGTVTVTVTAPGYHPVTGSAAL